MAATWLKTSTQVLVSHCVASPLPLETSVNIWNRGDQLLDLWETRCKVGKSPVVVWWPCKISATSSLHVRSCLKEDFGVWCMGGVSDQWTWSVTTCSSSSFLRAPLTSPAVVGKLAYSTSRWLHLLHTEQLFLDWGFKTWSNCGFMKPDVTTSVLEWS